MDEEKVIPPTDREFLWYLLGKMSLDEFSNSRIETYANEIRMQLKLPIFIKASEKLEEIV
jgi:hypothetical protein